MTFLHKLAQRLARLKVTLIIGLLAALACERPVTAVLNAALRVASVFVSPPAASLPVGRAVQLTATPRDSTGAPLTGRALTWLSTNLNVAAVDGSGLVTAQAPGATTIAAVSEGVTGTAALTVTNIPVASVTVTPATGSIAPGQMWQLTATPKDANGTALTGRVVTWVSSATAIATVSVSGLVTGVAAGSTTITATSEGQSGTAAVTVSVVPVATVTVTPGTASIPLGQTWQLTATPKDANGTTLTGRVITWASNATGVATVSALGLVTSVAVGSATITATSEGVNGSAVVTVTVPAPGGVVFQSNWTAGLGNGNGAIGDGGLWGGLANAGSSVLSVVAGGPSGYANALRVQQQGPSGTGGWGYVQYNGLPPATDFYVRFYMRNDDTSPAEDHIVAATFTPVPPVEMFYMSKRGGATSWSVTLMSWALSGPCGPYDYPVAEWELNGQLARGRWYRFEYYVHFVTPGVPGGTAQMQYHPRIYDDANVLLYQDADFRQRDYGTATYQGSSTWTLDQFWATGHSRCVDVSRAGGFSMGNNGQAGAVNTGLYWYYAGVQIRTDHWAGP